VESSESRPDEPRIQRLFPDPGETTFPAELDDYNPFGHPFPDRPWVAVNMVTTLDGRAALRGNTRGLGSQADTSHLLHLRSRFDAVMIGAGTMRAERYGRIITDPQVRAHRERIGLPHDPLAVILSESLDLPWDAKLFTEGAGRIQVFTRQEPDPRPPAATSLRIDAMPGGVEVAEVLRRLRQEHSVRAVLCEGGPHLLGQLLDADLVDELFLTVTPLATGGEAPRIVEGQGLAPRKFEPDRVYTGGGDLLTRYRRRR